MKTTDAVDALAACLELIRRDDEELNAMLRLSRVAQLDVFVEDLASLEDAAPQCPAL